MQRAQIVGAVLLVAAYAPAQTLSPRELFYGQGRTTPQKAASTAAKPKVAAKKAAATGDDTDTSAVLSPAPHSSGAAANVPVAEYVSNKVGPLGLKYSVLKRGEDGQYSEIDSDTTFVARDHIKLTLEVNDTGYLYVIAQGSSGIWQVLYPSKELNDGDNRVQAGHVYTIPSDAVFSFDSRAGTEKLFLILSRQPEQDLESLIYSLKDKRPAQGELSRPLMASNVGPVQDDVVQRLRQTYSRDLVVEKVDDSKTPPPAAVQKLEHKQGVLITPGEKAVYVVNRNAGPDARVVADVSLRHN